MNSSGDTLTRSQIGKANYEKANRSLTCAACQVPSREPTDNPDSLGISDLVAVAHRGVTNVLIRSWAATSDEGAYSTHLTEEQGSRRGPQHRRRPESFNPSCWRLCPSDLCAVHCTGVTVRRSSPPPLSRLHLRWLCYLRPWDGFRLTYIRCARSRLYGGRASSISGP
jgi:hypothetical protein